MYVSVRDNNVDQALRILKKKMQREGVFREMKNRRVYEKPSEKMAWELAESTRRVRILMWKRLEREGYYYSFVDNFYTVHLYGFFLRN